MPLKLPLPTDFGVKASFWRVGAFGVDLLESKNTVTLLGYFSAEAYAAGHRPLAAIPIVLDGEDFLPAPTPEALEEKIGRTPSWRKSKTV